MEFSEFEKAPQTKIVRCRNTVVSLIEEEPASPAGSSFMLVMAAVCFAFLVLAIILTSRC